MHKIKEVKERKVYINQSQNVLKKLDTIKS